MPNYDQITGQLRVIAPAVLAWFAAHGIVTNWWENIAVVVAVTLACCIWDYYNNPSGKTIP